MYFKTMSNVVLVRNVVCWFLFLDIPVSLTSIPFCLTWNTTSSYLFLNCIVYQATSVSEIFLVDPYGINRAQCLKKDFPGCDEDHQQDEIYTDVSDNITTLTIKTPKDVAEGEWKCRHGNDEKISNISYTAGTPSMINIELSGEIVKTKEEQVFKLECFSCWKPYIEGVEIYVNGVLEDSIRYQHGLCYHRGNLCNPEKCKCSRGNNYYYTWNLNSNLSNIEFTCSMRFVDRQTFAIAVHQASMIYNGKEFIQKQKTYKPIKQVDKNPGNTNTDSERTNNPGYIGESVLGTVGLIILLVLLICIWQIFKKRKKQANDQDRKSQCEFCPLQEKESSNDILHSTGTFQEDTFVLTLKNIFNIVLADKNIDRLAMYSNARDQLINFGFEILKSLGVEVEKDRVSFHMNKLQSLEQRNRLLLHDATECLFKDRSFRFLRLYDVNKLDLHDYKLNENMYKLLYKICEKIIEKKSEKSWYHYRRNGLTYKGSNEGAFILAKNVFLNKNFSSHFQQFSSYESRLGTFHNYPNETKSYRKKLALAGFFYIGVSDYVQCHNCGGCLRDWQDLIDPLERHIETFEICDFATDPKRKRSSMMNDGPLKYVTQQTYENRLVSFKSFPDTLLGGDFEQLALAGFYYCGIAKDIECCACNIEFSDIENTEYILRQHKKSSPECPYTSIYKCENQTKRKDKTAQENHSFTQYLELESRSHNFRSLNI